MTETTLDEFVGGAAERDDFNGMYESDDHTEDPPLKFTGNWFIDAGILGFVNLMEEVYGWNLEELQRRIKEEPEKVYYGYFPLGYLFYHSTMPNIYGEIQNVRSKKNELNQKIQEVEKECKDLSEKLELTKDKKEKRKLQNKLSNKLEKKISLNREKEKKVSDIKELKNKLEKERNNFQINASSVKELSDFKENEIKKCLPNFKLKLPAIAVNFYLFNPKEVNPYLAYRYLQLLCKKDYNNLNAFIKNIRPKSNKAKGGLNYEIHPDSTINPFLYSSEKFPNIGYTKPLKAVEIENSLKLNLPIFVSLLCFEHAFENYYEKGLIRNIFLYINNLDVCYYINKRMRMKKERAINKSKQYSLFKLAFSSVFDELTEHKASFSLENMYLIEYEGIEKQKLSGVEYIGIPKLQASILLDDTIREALNKSIQYKKIGENKKTGKKRFEWIWLLEEFIKGRPLYPVILNHVNVVLNDKINLSWYLSLYSLIVDANILQFRAKKEKQSKGLFSENYFDNYRALNKEIKDDLRYTSYKASLIKGISDDETKKRIAREMVEALKARDKNVFLNTLLRNLNENTDLFDANRLGDWIFEKIITNDLSFERYGLILVMNLLRGVKNEQ